LNNQLADPRAEGKWGCGKKRSAEASDAEAEVEEASHGGWFFVLADRDFVIAERVFVIRDRVRP